jgi:hypothetical protein
MRLGRTVSASGSRCTGRHPTRDWSPPLPDARRLHGPELAAQAQHPRHHTDPVTAGLTLRRSNAAQSRHDGPGGATSAAATTRCPHSAANCPRLAAWPSAMARSSMRWSRPSTVLVTAVGREVMACRPWSTVGIAKPFRDWWGLCRPRRVPPPGPFSQVMLR